MIEETKISINTAPISVNSAYRRSAGYGMHMTKEAHAYKEAIHWTVWEKRRIYQRPIVKIVFTFGDKKRHDIDNYLKLLLDAMNGLMYVDDNDIVQLHVYKLYNKNKPNITIVISNDLPAN